MLVFLVGRVAAATAVAAAFEARHEAAAAGETAACAANNTPYYRENDETANDHSCDNWPFAVGLCHAVVPA